MGFHLPCFGHAFRPSDGSFVAVNQVAQVTVMSANDGACRAFSLHPNALLGHGVFYGIKNRVDQRRIGGDLGGPIGCDVCF